MRVQLSSDLCDDLLTISFTSEQASPELTAILDQLMIEAFLQYEKTGDLDLGRTWARLYVHAYCRRYRAGTVRLGQMHDALIDEGLIEEQEAPDGD